MIAIQDAGIEIMKIPLISESPPKHVLTVLKNWSTVDLVAKEFIEDAIVRLCSADYEFAPEFEALALSEDVEIDVREIALWCLEAILGSEHARVLSIKQHLLPELSVGSRILSYLSEVVEKMWRRLQ